MIDNKNKIKVLFLNSRSEFGGADICLLEIIKHLDKEKIDSVILLPESGPLVDSLLRSGVGEIIFINANPLERPEKLIDIIKFFVKLLPVSLKIMKIIRRHSIDLVYTNSSAIQTGAIAAFLSKKPHVWHIREIWTSPIWLTRSLNYFIYHFSGRIITITDAVRTIAFPQKKHKITTIYDGIDIQRFENFAGVENLIGSLGITKGAKIVGIVARIIPLKGHLLLLQAIERLIREKTDVHLVVLGDAPRQMYKEYYGQLQTYVEEKEVSQNIHFVGWQKNIPSWLQIFDALVLPSIHPEGLGVVIPEAWAGGVPVIASNHGGPQEIIQNGVDGILFEPNSVEKLYEAIKLVLNDVDLQAILIKNGKLSVVEKFDAKKNTQIIQHLIVNLVK